MQQLGVSDGSSAQTDLQEHVAMQLQATGLHALPRPSPTQGTGNSAMPMASRVPSRIKQ